MVGFWTTVSSSSSPSPASSPLSSERLRAFSGKTRESSLRILIYLGVEGRAIFFRRDGVLWSRFFASFISRFLH